jgi:MFS transporter, DHA1 family, multidrug resistance protein
MNMIIPFLPLFIQGELGVTDVKAAALWSAVIFGANHVSIALVSPIWGRLSDRFGQKIMMIRSSVGMGIIIIGMGFVETPLQLLLLRALFGTIAGFLPVANAFMAINTPKEYTGTALGTLQTGSVTGQMIGPLIGGLLAGFFGFRDSFFITGAFLLAAAFLIIFGVKETRTYEKLRWHHLKESFSRKKQGAAPDLAPPKNSIAVLIKQAPILLTLFTATFLIAASMQSINPIITLYVKQLNVENHVELVGGMIFAASALGTMIAAPLLGRLGDRIGHSRVLLVSVILMAILNIPQALADDPWSLLGIRFLSGLCIGGLVPSVSSLLRRMTSPSIQGSVFGYNTSANSFGNVSGAMFGGFVASTFGIPYVFYFITALFVILFFILIHQRKRLEPVRATDSGMP